MKPHPTPYVRHRREKMSAEASTERGIMANDVAKRCESLDSAEDIALLWWLQWASHQNGGLVAVAKQLVDENPNACLSVRLASVQPSQLQMQIAPTREASLRRESEAFWDLDDLFLENLDQDTPRENWSSVGDIIEGIRRETVARLSEHLLEACIKPRGPLSDDEPRFFRGLRSALSRLIAGREAALRSALVGTEVARKVQDAFGYAQRTRSLVLVNGPARIGKTFSGRAWCEQRPGVARYAQVPASGDDLSFFRVLARALGVPFKFDAKVVELRCHIEEVLQRGDLLLCLDEAHYLWPQSTNVTSLPRRISWLMTAVMNYNVPVVALTTPQFFHHLKRIEDGSMWTSQQFTGRVGKFVQLPESVGEEDLAAVALHLVPELGSADVRALVSLASSSGRYLAAIDGTVRAARDNANQSGRTQVTPADLRRAISESVLPSDLALASVLARSSTKTPRRRRAFADPMQPAGTVVETPPSGRATTPAETISPTLRVPQRGGILTEA